MKVDMSFHKINKLGYALGGAQFEVYEFIFNQYPLRLTWYFGDDSAIISKKNKGFQDGFLRVDLNWLFKLDENQFILNLVNSLLKDKKPKIIKSACVCYTKERYYLFLTDQDYMFWMTIDLIKVFPKRIKSEMFQVAYEDSLNGLCSYQNINPLVLLTHPYKVGRDFGKFLRDCFVCETNLQNI